MKYQVKVVSSKKYELTEHRLGNSIQYAQVEFNGENYTAIIDPNKKDRVLLLGLFANKILTDLVK